MDDVIRRIDEAVKGYPYAETYHVWPGPNSNTFTAFVLRDVPELRVDLPPTAIGKDFLGLSPVALTPSGTGGQLSLLGVAGVTAGWEEGVELNLLGLTLGLDPKSLAVKLPLVGSVGREGRASDRQCAEVAGRDAAQRLGTWSRDSGNSAPDVATPAADSAGSTPGS